MEHNSAVIDDVSRTSPFDSGRHAEVMPTDKEYMKTGKMPVEEETEQKDKPAAGKAADEPTPGAEDDAGGEHAASSHDATSQKDKPGKESQQRTPENRFQKLSRRNRELELENARLKGLQEGRDESRPTQDRTREQRQDARTGNESTDKTSKPTPRPRIDDIDPNTKKPKYANMQEYEDAVDKWHDERVTGIVRNESAKTDRERSQSENDRIIETEVNKRVAAARKEYSDYDDVMGNVFTLKDEHGHDEFFYAKGSHLDGFFLDSERGHDVMYQLAKNWDKHKAIFARDAKGAYLMNPVRQLRELSKIELALPAKGKAAAGSSSGNSNTGNASAQRPSQAPRPPHQTSGTGVVTKEAREQAVDEQDQETYRRAANEEDPRLKAYRASQGKK